MDTQEAFETLLADLQAALERTQESIENAGKRSDFGAIKEAADRGGMIQAQLDRLKALRRQWGDVVGTGTPTEEAKRAPRGASTPQKDYRVPILRVLDAMGGQGRTADVLDRVGELMEGQLTELDQQMLPSGADIRWRNRAQWARNTMVNEGLLASDSPHGIWEITEKGREVLRERRSR